MAVPGALPPTPPRLSPVSSGSPDTAKIIRDAAIVDEPAQEILSRTPPDAKRSLFSRASAGISGLLGTCADRVAGSLDRICGRGSFPKEMKRPLLAQEAPVGQKFPPSPAKSAKPKQDSAASAAGVFPDAEGPAEGDIPLGTDIPLEHMTEAAFASEMNRRHPGFLDNHPHLYNVYKRMKAVYNSPAVAFIACLGMAGWLSAGIATEKEDLLYGSVGLGAMLKHLKDCLLSGEIDLFFERWKDLVLPMALFFIGTSCGYTFQGHYKNNPKVMKGMNIGKFAAMDGILGLLIQDGFNFFLEAARRFKIVRKDDAEVKRLEGKMREAIASKDTKELRKVISELLRINSKRAIFGEMQAKEQLMLAELRKDPEWEEIIKAHELETGKELFEEFFMKKRLEEAEAKGIIYATPEECFMALCKEIEDQSKAQASSKTRSFVKYTAGVVPGAALMAARLAASGSPFALMFEELGSMFLFMTAGYLGEDGFNRLLAYGERTHHFKLVIAGRCISVLKRFLFGILTRNITEEWANALIGFLCGMFLQDSSLKMEADLIKESIRKIEQIGTKDVNGLIRELYGLLENVEKEKKDRLVKALGKIVEELKDKSPYGAGVFPWMWGIFAVANIFTGWYFHPEGYNRIEDLLRDSLYFGASFLNYGLGNMLRRVDYHNPRCCGVIAEGLKACRLVLSENLIGLASSRLWLYSYLSRNYIMNGMYEKDPNTYKWLSRIYNMLGGLTVGGILQKVQTDGREVRTSNSENQTYLPSLFVNLGEQLEVLRRGQLDQWV